MIPSYKDIEEAEDIRRKADAYDEIVASFGLANPAAVGELVEAVEKAIQDLEFGYKVRGSHGWLTESYERLRAALAACKGGE